MFISIRRDIVKLYLICSPQYHTVKKTSLKISSPTLPKRLWL